MRQAPRSQPLRPGFTLLELLLSLSITGVIGVAVIMLAGAAAFGTSQERDGRRAQLRRQVATERIGSLTRPNVMILAATPNRLLLWKSDTSENALPNLSELRLIEWNSATRELAVYEAPASFNPAAEVVYSFSSNYSLVANAIVVTFSKQTILKHIVAWNVQLDGATPQASRRMRLEFTISNESGSDAAVLTSSLRGFP